MHSATWHGVVLALPLLVAAGFWVASRLDRKHQRGGPGFVERNGALVATYLLLAVGLWTVFMILLPLLSMVELSFRPKLPPIQMGGPRDIYTLANYRYFLFGSGFDGYWNTLHLRAFGTTILASVVVTLIDLMLCYPLAYVMAQVAAPARVRLLLLLLIVPYWLNEVLRAFGIRVLLNGGGLVNRVLQAAHVIAQPIDFIGQDVALYVGLTYAYMLLMVFPLYNALSSLDHSQIEAARDLGAPSWRIHADVVIPFIKPGIASGCTLVFMLNAGALATPQILGGPRTLWFTPIVYDRFYQAFNWPQGAAYAFMLLLACIAFVTLVLRVFRLSLGQVVRWTGKLVDRALLAAYMLGFFGFLFAPVLVMAITAFNASSYPQVLPFEGLSLQWFATLLADDEMLYGIGNSLRIGVCVVLLSVPLGLAGAIVMQQVYARARGVYYLVVVAPVLTPGIIIGISTVIFWRSFTSMTGTRFLYNGTVLTVLGQSSFIASYCMLIFLARLQRFDPALAEAALDLGATQGQAFRDVLLPFLRPAVLSAAVIAFLSSFENYNTTTFAILADKTLVTILAGRMRQGLTPAVSALAVAIVAVTVAGALVYEILHRREDRQRAQRRDEAQDADSRDAAATTIAMGVPAGSAV